MSHITTSSLFFPGNVARVECQFVNSGGVLVNPSSTYAAVHFFGATSSVDVTSLLNPSTGLFYFDLHIDSGPGEYMTRFTGKLSGKAQAFGAVHVTTPTF